jgi:hypothetical protein
MEIIAINDCNHDYEVIVALKAHELMDLQQATYAYVGRREDWWVEKGCPTPNGKDKDWRMTMDINLNIMLRARELHGAISVLADGAMAWSNRIEDFYYSEMEDDDGSDED